MNRQHPHLFVAVAADAGALAEPDRAAVPEHRNVA